MVDAPRDESGPVMARRALLAGACCAAVGAALVSTSARSRRSLLRQMGETVWKTSSGESIVITRTNGQRRAVQPDGLFRVRTREPVVALTFDDGPDPRYTPRVLDLLRDAGAHATFFLVGVNALAFPALVRRILDEGHSIGNHTFDHRELELLSERQVRNEIDRGRRALISTGAPRPELFRPPKGYTDDTVAALAGTEHVHTVFWDACVERCVDHQPVSDGVRELVGGVRPGSIILAHDGGSIVGSGRRPLSRARTMKALPFLLDGLRERGLEVVDVHTLTRGS
jgi:peptidoglycan/xylan/chitin deacetylase (PgdA/CDA1 family)